jgi:hypothetical protein
MTPVPQRTCAVPDLGGELLDPLRVTEEVLLSLAGWESDKAGDGLVAPLPPPLAHNHALNAVQRLLRALAGTQGRDSAQGRLLAPDGRYEHAPVTFIDVATDDIATIAATARRIDSPSASEDLCDAIEVIGGAVYPLAAMTRAELASGLARITGLLDLAWAPELERLQDVTFTVEEEAAYQATVDWFNAMWALSSGIDRFLY